MNNRGGKKGLEVAKKDKQTWNNKAAKLRKVRPRGTARGRLFQWHNNEVLFYETIQKLSSVECLPQLYCGRKFDDENQDIGFVCMEYADGCHLKHIYDNLSSKEVEKALVSMTEIQSIMHKVPETERHDFGVSAYEELYADILNSDVLSFRLDELRLLDPSLSHLISEADLEASKLPSTKMVRRLHEDLGLGPVFVNGDMYSPNLLWKIDENGESQLHKMIDWQVILGILQARDLLFQFCHYGCAAEDIVRLLITSTSTEDRRNGWERWLRLYYTELENRMEDAPFTLEQVFNFPCDRMIGDLFQLTAAYRQLFSLAAFAFLGTVPEVYRAATQNCSEEEKRKRQISMAAKVRGLLEDLLDYDGRKCG